MDSSKMNDAAIVLDEKNYLDGSHGRRVRIRHYCNSKACTKEGTDQKPTGALVLESTGRSHAVERNLQIWSGSWKWTDTPQEEYHSICGVEQSGVE